MPSLPLDALRKLDLPLTEIVAGRIGFVHDAFLCFPYEVRDSLPSGEQDLVVLVGKRKRPEIIRALAEHRGRLVLVFVAGDGPVDPRHLGVRATLPPNVVAAFAANNELGDGRVVSLPLGVRASNLRALQFVRQNSDRQRLGLLYGNFTVNEEHYRPDPKTGTSHIRVRLVEQLRGAPWARLETRAERRPAEAELIRYYARMARHKFVLSPEGNGVDCYRTWEALYLGAIPIVMLSPTTSAFADLPILFTEDYGELSEDYLTRRWREMSSRSFEIERMLRSWYLSRFLAVVGTLDDPGFVCLQVDGSPGEKFIETLRLSSRSASRAMIETPLPPFSYRGDLMAARTWTAAPGMRVEQCENGLRFLALGNGRAAAEAPLHTIVGGSFRLTGRIRAEGNDTGPLAVKLEARPDALASAEVGDGPLELDFTARADRTVLSVLGPDASSQGSWLLSDLAVNADL